MRLDMTGADPAFDFREGAHEAMAVLCGQNVIDLQ